MSTLIREAQAGTGDRGDVVISLKPVKAGSGIAVSIESKVESLYHEQIEDAVKDILKENGITDVAVDVKDQSALDFVIRARTEAAILRALRPVEKEV